MEKTYREKCGYIGKHRYHINNYKMMSGGGNGKPTVYLFKADFCGHCQSFKPTWDKLQQQYKERGINFVTYDSDQDGGMMERYNVMGFPTIIMETGNEIKEFDDMRTIEKLSKFIDSNL
jgi:thiol-disulfide isomerase/thioredoxin